MSVEDFRKQFASLPCWEGTRYAIVEGANNAIDGRILDYGLFLFDCQTAKRLIATVDEPVAGRESEVAQLRSGIEEIMRGEAFALL